jgi:hypothetical protein
MSEKYIYERINPSGDKVYIIRKTFNNRMFNYGTYDTLPETKKHVEELIVKKKIKI